MLTAIVLAREDIREYDQRITLYTHERGLVVAHATGVKKIASKQSPRLEPGMLVHAEVVRAGSGDKLVAAEPIAHYPQIRRSYRRALVVQYVLGLAASTAFPGQPDRALFDFLRIFLGVAARIP
ncbi:MAG: DNA repair protein RecO, partial [Patescibacteria group bacterium]